MIGEKTVGEWMDPLCTDRERTELRDTRLPRPLPGVAAPHSAPYALEALD